MFAKNIPKQVFHTKPLVKFNYFPTFKSLFLRKCSHSQQTVFKHHLRRFLQFCVFVVLEEKTVLDVTLHWGLQTNFRSTS